LVGCDWEQEDDIIPRKPPARSAVTSAAVQSHRAARESNSGSVRSGPQPNAHAKGNDYEASKTSSGVIASSVTSESAACSARPVR
jgi:hypothetical protein